MKINQYKIGDRIIVSSSPNKYMNNQIGTVCDLT
jgi:hypothetical protein